MIDVRRRLDLPSGTSRTYYSLPMLEKTGIAGLSRLPVTIRILLESVLRHVDGVRIRDEDVEVRRHLVGERERLPADERGVGEQTQPKERPALHSTHSTIGRSGADADRNERRRRPHGRCS